MASEYVIAQLTLGVDKDGVLFIEQQSLPLKALNSYPEVAHAARVVLNKIDDIVEEIKQ